MNITDLMELGKNYNFEGHYAINNKFKFIEGRMYTFNSVTGSWVKPSITSYWLKHTFSVENVTKRELLF